MSRINSKYIPLAATALVMVVLYVLGCILYPNFGSLRVAVNLFGDNAFLGIAAVGATFVILSGGIDLSVGAVVAFIGIFVAAVIAKGMTPEEMKQAAEYPARRRMPEVGEHRTQ